MIGAIVGDIIVSVYEWNNIKTKVIRYKEVVLWQK